MLVYPLPPDRDYVWSLKDVSCSIKTSDQQARLRSVFHILRWKDVEKVKKLDDPKVKALWYQLHKLKRKPVWPPKDDPYIDYHIGWLPPHFPPTERDQELGNWTERFCAHRLGLYIINSPAMSDCLTYVHNAYLKQYGSKEWVKVEGEAGYRQRRMVPQEQHLKEIRTALLRLLPNLNNEPLNDKLILRTEYYTMEDISKVYQFCLPWIAKWCLHSYLTFPEDWTGGSGQYVVSSIFKHETVQTGAAGGIKIDTSPAAILAAAAARKQNDAAASCDDGGEFDGSEEISHVPANEKSKDQAADKAAKRQQKKQKEVEEQHWLDDAEHSFKLRHGEW